MELLHKEERVLEEIRTILGHILHVLRRIEHQILPSTPTAISFKEITMLPTVGGNTLIFTGTLSPLGAQYPAGTTFTVTSNDPAVSPTVDPTGLIVTIPLPTGWVENPTTPLAIAYSTSTFVPNPSTSPSQITSTITPSVPTVTPTGIAFGQTQ
jgi:hypothetical protein